MSERLIGKRILYEDWDMPIIEFVAKQQEILADVWKPDFLTITFEWHRIIVEQAIAEGYEVPYEVLRFYPDLRDRQYKPETVGTKNQPSLF